MMQHVNGLAATSVLWYLMMSFAAWDLGWPPTLEPGERTVSMIMLWVMCCCYGLIVISGRKDK